jgi:pimeloyl-ACP methyl ester carboxylesterase
MPGRGRSDWLTNPNLYQVPVYVADMVTLIARLDARSLYWFGTSMGGLIGMGLASLAGSPIERLILNDVGPVISAAGVERIGEYLSQPIRFKSLDEAEQYIRMISAPFGEHTDAEWRHLTEISIRRDGDEWVTHYDPAIAIPFKAAVAANPEGTDTLLWNVYDTVTARTLSVRGELSDLLTPETQREMAARGPKAELVTIPKVGHAPMFMHSDQIAIVEEFFSRA